MSDSSSCVLIVDDNEALLELFAEVLENRYTVFKAKTIADALQLLETQEVSAVITDLHVGQQNGLELVSWIRQHRKQLISRIALITGSLTAIVHDPDVHVLFKPVSLDLLLHTADKMIDGIGCCEGQA